MIEPNFVAMYTRDFVTLATRGSAAAPGGEATLVRKVVDTRAHAAIMDAKKGGSHLEAIASALESQAALPAAQAYRPQPPEEWAARAAFLQRSADLLRDPSDLAGAAAPAKPLALRLPA